jgi:hypothetical protein
MHKEGKNKNRGVTSRYRVARGRVLRIRQRPSQGCSMKKEATRSWRGDKSLLEQLMLGEGFFFGGKADGLGGACGDLGLLDAAKEDAAEFVGGFVVETEVRILFHHIKCVAEFVSEFRLRCAD